MTKGSLLKKIKRLLVRGGRRAAVASSSADAAAEKWRAEENNRRRRIPSDVPKGHLAVYVGERQKRFVIKVTTLKHPLFISLLDETAGELQDEYEYDDSKFWIPCDENIFISVIRCATPPPTKPISICIC